MSFKDAVTAQWTRDVLQRLIVQVLDQERPRYQYGTVTYIDSGARTCLVLFPGDLTPVTIPFGAVRPSEVGQVVRVDGYRGDRFVSEVTTSFGRPWIEVSAYATAGIGTSADPWTGWETAFAALAGTTDLTTGANFELRMGKGFYLQTATLAPPNSASHFTWYGAGKHATTVTWAGGNSPMVKITNARNVTIAGMALVGNSTPGNRPTYGIQVDRSSGLVGSPGPTGVRIRDMFIGGTSADAMSTGIGYSATVDANNDLGTFTDVDILNVGRGYKFGHVNALYHSIIGGSLTSCSVAAIDNTPDGWALGGSYKCFGTNFGGNAETLRIGPITGNDSIDLYGISCESDLKLITTPTPFRPGRQFTDGVLNSTTTLTSATAAFTAGDVGQGLYGTGIPGGAFIAGYVNSTTVTLSVPATTTATGVTVTLAGESVQLRVFGGHWIGADPGGSYTIDFNVGILSMLELRGFNVGSANGVKVNLPTAGSMLVDGGTWVTQEWRYGGILEIRGIVEQAGGPTFTKVGSGKLILRGYRGHDWLDGTAAPSVSVGGAVGAGGSVSVVGDDHKGVITFTPAGSPGGAGPITQVIFTSAFPGAPVVTISPYDADAAGIIETLYVSSASVGSWQLETSTTLAVLTEYKIAYSVR